MNTPAEIFKEYEKSRNFKARFGEKGMYEQNIINRRFYSGDQWYGATVSSERPLVRHNIIRRIGEYKMGELINRDIKITLCTEGVGFTAKDIEGLETDKEKLSAGEYKFDKNTSDREVRILSSALSDYFEVCSKNNRLSEKLADILKNSFITGTGVLYTYWDIDAAHGKGDISCEVLPIENLYFGDNTAETVEKQPYIIIVTRPDTEEVKRTASLCGCDPNLIKPDNLSGTKTTVYTKLFKKYDGEKECIMAVSVTEKAYVRPEYDTYLTKYPINIFTWDKQENCIFGESEVTYLIPNQIAINRMLSASVWASMYMGMPIMTVNGDTVTEDITNDPGQIIKVYGTNEDVAGAVHYVAPPDFSSGFNAGVSSLIQNTLESSGAGMTALSKIGYNNTAAIESIASASGISAASLNVRYRSFLSEIALTFVDFWMNKYGRRPLLIEDKNGRWYFPFDSDRYKGLRFYAETAVKEEETNESH